MKCEKCSDTGSLSKDLDGHLDCGYCAVAQERAALDTWAAKHLVHVTASAERWELYQHGKAAAARANN